MVRLRESAAHPKGMAAPAPPAGAIVPPWQGVVIHVNLAAALHFLALWNLGLLHAALWHVGFAFPGAVAIINWGAGGGGHAWAVINVNGEIICVITLLVAALADKLVATHTGGASKNRSINIGSQDGKLAAAYWSLRNHPSHTKIACDRLRDAGLLGIARSAGKASALGVNMLGGIHGMFSNFFNKPQEALAVFNARRRAEGGAEHLAGDLVHNSMEWSGDDSDNDNSSSQ